MSDLSLPEPYPQVLDIQHDTDPAQDHGEARRIPHLGHALLFFGILFVSVIAFFIIPALAHMHVRLNPPDAHLAALATLCGYALTFAISFPVFPLLWRRSFLDGIHWTYRAARLRWWKLILLGFALSAAATVAEHFVKAPKDIDILKLLDTPLSAWFTALSGAFIAPLVEEIAFRGFLLPAIATAYDWLSLERTPAAVNRWRLTTTHTPSGLVLAAIVSSAAFAALHGSQLHWPVGTLIILFIVSMVLSAVRIRYHSVAASALVHVSYNSLLFLLMIISTHGFRHLDHISS